MHYWAKLNINLKTFIGALALGAAHQEKNMLLKFTEIILFYLNDFKTLID